MKQFMTILSVLVVLSSCKKDTKKEAIVPTKELTTAQKIANAHGYENWKNISKIEFTFNTSRGARSWTWEPKTQNVRLIQNSDTISYNRSKINSTSSKADRAFINDKYWFLAPFQLVWDKNASTSEVVKALAPISNIEMNKITLTYPNTGGYTPGDAYDFFFGDDYLIKEWIYRKGNSEAPSMMTTWEDYEDIKGLKISKMHKNAEDNWNLYFTGVSVTTE
ncbi:hypothetical protein ACS386_05140 [Flavobacteriaceae bacterium LMO-SS05]